MGKEMRKKRKCIVCNEIRLIHGHDRCLKCYIPPKKQCVKCDKIKSIHGNNLCEPCYRKQKRKEDGNKLIISRLRAQIAKCFRKYSSAGKIMVSEKYDINYEKIIEHLGPCPGEREDYHIDHIFPLSAFDFNNKDHIKAAFAPENHQWLKISENIQKGCKYDEREFIRFIKMQTM